MIYRCLHSIIQSWTLMWRSLGELRRLETKPVPLIWKRIDLFDFNFDFTLFSTKLHWKKYIAFTETYQRSYCRKVNFLLNTYICEAAIAAFCITQRCYVTVWHLCHDTCVNSLDAKQHWWCVWQTWQETQAPVLRSRCLAFASFALMTSDPRNDSEVAGDSYAANSTQASFFFFFFFLTWKCWQRVRPRYSHWRFLSRVRCVEESK